ncbi:G-type lectin S-receptor serine/threonine-protein kinase SD1-1 [Spatholobus suberectus]|nr:G-type lectin S-receptor serine/threonine-protein kinase SD1-1 [Spatholobus suberectus]
MSVKMQGVLVDGYEIAPKKLSSSSRQGFTEFLNDVKLIVKLQHRNLVKLLGWCIQGQEKMVVCEYIPNSRLNSFIFEYAADGLFSEKSDVFSFGILVLEVICGRRNRGLYQADYSLNLIGYAWTIWKEGKALEFDSKMKESCTESEVLRCLHISLLCMQQYPEDRPAMASVILILGSEMELVEPKEPGFVYRNVSVDADSCSNLTDASLANDVTISFLEPR